MTAPADVSVLGTVAVGEDIELMTNRGDTWTNLIGAALIGVGPTRCCLAICVKVLRWLRVR